MKVRMTRRSCALAGAVLVALAVTACAHAQDAADLAGAAQVVVKGKRADQGPSVSPSGANTYTVSADTIAMLPTGEASTLTDVLTRMPGVAIDQNQQIHIRNTEGPQFQYQINGVLVPLDINTNPPFLSMLNPLFIERMDLLDGVLPSRYSYATGGVVDIQVKDGCEGPHGEASITAGQRDTLEPTVQYAGCTGRLSYYLSGTYEQGPTAFSAATPGPNPIHDYTHQVQVFGYFNYRLNDTTSLSLLLSTAASDNQLPNVRGLAPQFALAGAPALPSAKINSHLDFIDDLAIVTLKSQPSANLTWQLAYAAHAITQDFRPDDVGELIFQGVASHATHSDIDNTLEGDLTYEAGRHELSAGFYAGAYQVSVRDNSLVFPVDANGDQSSNIPVRVINDDSAANVVLGIYLNDLWRITDALNANVGLRLDGLSGFTDNTQIDPTLNLTYAASPGLSLHAGFARYMQVPSFQGISPTAPAAFAGTTAQGPPGAPTPLTEDDYEWDAGAVAHLSPALTASIDGFYELTRHYLDTGQFSVVPIFAPFNYEHGYIWGTELALTYRRDALSAYANLTIGENWEKGVATGQFNFDADELAYIDGHDIVLDHQPHVGVSAGATYDFAPYAASVDLLYSSGLRGGFADDEQLPPVVQVNASIQRTFDVPRVGKVVDRITVLNAFDRVNLIRPAEGIGIFQSAYGPRFTVLDTISVPF
jgi:hypothetical protein